MHHQTLETSWKWWNT